MSDLTYFERLGLPRRFELDGDSLEREYLARSRQLHPDYHQLGSDASQRASLELSSALNEAYNVLRDPFRRAEYLLALHGGPSAGEVKELPQVFLMEMLELREQIEEIKTPGSPCYAAIHNMENELIERRDTLLKEVSRTFASLESLSDAQRSSLLRSIRERLNAVKYIQGLIRDLQAD